MKKTVSFFQPHFGGCMWRRSRVSGCRSYIDSRNIRGIEYVYGWFPWLAVVHYLDDSDA